MKVRLFAIVCAVLLLPLVWGCSRPPFQDPLEYRTIDVPKIRAGKAPRFDLRALDGGTLRLEDFQGKVVLLNFWASWCGPCVHELENLEYLHQHLRRHGFSVVGVAVDRNPDDARSVAKRLKLSFPILLDPLSIAQTRYAATSVPSSFILDGEGFLRVVPDPLHLIPDSRFVGERAWSGGRAISILEGVLRNQ